MPCGLLAPGKEIYLLFDYEIDWKSTLIPILNMKRKKKINIDVLELHGINGAGSWWAPHCLKRNLPTF